MTRALAADLERLRGGLRIIALRALGDPDAAEEAVQETIARAVVALSGGRLDDPAKLPAYVAGIARHVCSHIHRDRKHTVSIDDADDTEIAAADANREPSPDPLETLISEAETERLQVAFRALSAPDQRLLRLCFHEEKTPGEVALALGEPADRVRKRKSRALDRLRQAFLGRPEGHDQPSRGTGTESPMMSIDRGSKIDP